MDTTIWILKTKDTIAIPHDSGQAFTLWPSKSLPQITRYSNSVFSLENFNCYVNKQSNSSVYQILFKFYLQKAYFKVLQYSPVLLYAEKGSNDKKESNTWLHIFHAKFKFLKNLQGRDESLPTKKAALLISTVYCNMHTVFI